MQEENIKILEGNNIITQIQNLIFKIFIYIYNVYRNKKKRRYDKSFVGKNKSIRIR
jgi:hypothetical protein